MQDLTIITQGVQGGKINIQKTGKCIVEIRHSNDTIEVDNYEGAGTTYKRREQPLITITNNGEIIFSGTKHELFYILEQNK